MQFSSHGNDKLIAKIDNEKIYQSQVEEKLSQIFQNHQLPEKMIIENLPKQLIEGVVKDIYLQKQLNKIIKKSKFNQDPKLQLKIAQYQENLLQEAYISDRIANKINDDAITAKYNEIVQKLSGKKEVHLKHILVANQEQAQKILQELNQKGKKITFEELAKKYSEDQSNASQGGDLGYVITDNLDKDFANTVGNLKKNQVSSPIHTRFGWHIIKLAESREVVIPKLEEIKTNIKEELIREATDKIFKDILGKAKIEIVVPLKSDTKAKSDQINSKNIKLSNPSNSKELENKKNLINEESVTEKHTSSQDAEK